MHRRIVVDTSRPRWVPVLGHENHRVWVPIEHPVVESLCVFAEVTQSWSLRVASALPEKIADAESRPIEDYVSVDVDRLQPGST